MYETTFAGCCAARLGTRLARVKLVTRYCAVRLGKDLSKVEKEFAGYYGPRQAKRKRVQKRGRRGIGRRSSSLTNASCPAVAIAPSEPLYPIPSLRVGVPTTKEQRDRRDDVRRKKFGDIAGSFSPETSCVPTTNFKTCASSALWWLVLMLTGGYQYPMIPTVHGSAAYSLIQ